MISKEEKKLIIEAFGCRYTPMVRPMLKKLKLKNEKKKEYSACSIRMIVCGLQETEAVELAIIKFAKETIKAKKKMATQRKRLLKK